MGVCEEVIGATQGGNFVPAALSERPFYEEWWFLLVMALVGLILILILVFTLLLHGQSSRFKACGTGLCFFCCLIGQTPWMLSPL